jgi:sortase A
LYSRGSLSQQRLFTPGGHTVMSIETPAPQPSFLPRAATAAPRSVGSLLGLSMRRPGGRRAVSAITVLLFFSGVSVFAFPAITDYIQRTIQVHVKADFNSQKVKTAYRQQRIAVGAGLTKLIIDNPRVNVNVLVVEGTTVAALRAGAGHYVNTPYPCGPSGNVGIAGHRTTYGRPFNRINDMEPGDTVTLITPVSQCVYQVMQPAAAGESANPFVVLPTDGSVVTDGNVPPDGTAAAAAGPQWLTLTSCNPPGSAAQRMVLRLQMISCKGSTCHAQKGSAT